jgi:hypothetical protein
MEALSMATKDNFDDILQNTYTGPVNVNLTPKYPPRANNPIKRKFTEDEKAEIETFTKHLSNNLHNYYNTEISPDGNLRGADLFDANDCVAILSHMENIVEAKHLKKIIGAECFEGQHLWLFDWIMQYKAQEPQSILCLSNGSITPASKKTKRYGLLGSAGLERPQIPPQWWHDQKSAIS